MATEVIVLDNSINTRLLWPDAENPAHNQYALAVIRQAANGCRFHVPTIWHYEAAHVAAMLVRRGQVSQANATRYFEQLALLPINTDASSHGRAETATFALSIQFGLSVYDAAYLELVLRVDGALATNDQRMRTAAHRAGAILFDQ